MAGCVAHVYNLLLHFTNHYTTHYVFSSPSASTAASRDFPIFTSQLYEILIIQPRGGPTENTVSNNTPIVVFADPMLTNGFFYCCVHVYFRGISLPIPALRRQFAIFL
jgi:hypothetical protein